MFLSITCEIQYLKAFIIWNFVLKIVWIHMLLACPKLVEVTKRQGTLKLEMKCFTFYIAISNLDWSDWTLLCKNHYEKSQYLFYTSDMCLINSVGCGLQETWSIFSCKAPRIANLLLLFFFTSVMWSTQHNIFVFATEKSETRNKICLFSSREMWSRQHSMFV